MKNNTFYDVEKIANAESIDVNLADIKLDSYNVRFLHLPQRLSDKEIEKRLWEEKDTNEYQ